MSDASDADAERCWPFVNAQLAATGRDVWVASDEEGPKSARGPRAFEAGSLVTWTFRINQLAVFNNKRSPLLHAQYDLIFKGGYYQIMSGAHVHEPDLACCLLNNVRGPFAWD